MTGKETLIELINMGIVHKIGEEFFVTTNAREILDTNQLASNLHIPTVEVEIGELYPASIREANIDVKLKAVLDHCEVPALIVNEGSKFMVRSNDAVSRNTMLKILKDSSYEPTLVLTVIKEYYTKMPYPKAIKRFLGEGDFETLYELYKSGKEIEDEDKPDNTNWFGSGT